jgi:hypothetical protein
MFLSKILKNYSLNPTLFTTLKFYKYITKFKTIKLILNKLKEKNRLKSLNKIIYKDNVSGTQNFPDSSIRYLIVVKLTSTNVLISFTNIKGKILYCYSAGNVHFTGKQKKKSSNVIKFLLKHLIFRIFIIKDSPIALHFKNVKKGLQKLIINKIQDHFFIALIKTSDLHPYNGCRPKKIKRKKQRKKS